MKAKPLKLFNSSKATTEKNIPKFYKECINDFQELCRKAKIRDDNEIIWHNDFLKFQGESFAFKHWAKSGILNIKDLLKDGTIDEHCIWQKLPHKAGFVFELNKIKKAVPQHWLEWSKLKSIKDCCENDTLQFRFQIPNSGIKTLKDLTSKDIYNALLINNKTHVTSMHYWSRKFNDVDINWEHWFTQNFINKLLPRKCKDFNWKIFHGQLNTEIRLSKMKYSDGICKICKNEAENLDHMLYHCGQLEKLWKYMESLIKQSIFPEFTMTTFDITACFKLQKRESDLINVVLTLCRWTIWKRRNINRYESRLLNYDETVVLLRHEINQHIQMLLNSKYVKNDLTINLEKIIQVML